MKYLLHMGKETISDKLNDLPAFVFPPGKVVKVENDFLATKILEHLNLKGLVEVDQIGSDAMGMPLYDIKAAQQKGIVALKDARKRMVLNYIKSQREDRISANKPPLPPSPVVQKIIEEDGWDLAAEGINLMGAGFKVENKSVTNSGEIDELRQQLKDQGELLKQLLSDQNKALKEQKSKGV
jgi:hypothetical protein